MADIIGWPVGVNKRVLDSTNITSGEKGFVEDSDDGGNFTERRLTSLFAPQTFSVSMDFDFAKKDANGNSEYDRFMRWYEYRHKRGSNAFEFPSLTKYNIYGSTETCYYKITSSTQSSKSGLSQRVNMTWKEVYRGIIEIPDQEVSINGMEILVGETKCRAKISFTKEIDTEPAESDYPLFLKTTGGYKKLNTTITYSYGNHIHYSFTKPASYGTHIVVIATKKDGVIKEYSETFSASELNFLTNEISFKG